MTTLSQQKQESNNDKKNVTQSSSPVKARLNRENVYTLLQDPDTFATVLLTICLIMYGDETFKVDSLVLYQWLKEDFGTDLCEENESKLASIIIALTTDYFYTDLDVFKSICKTLSTGDPGAYSIELFDDAPTTPEVLWGMYEVSLVSEDQVVETEDFSPIVKLYIDAELSDNVDDIDGDGEEETFDPSLIIAENVNELRNQLVLAGLKDIPRFPAFEFDGDEEVQQQSN